MAWEEAIWRLTLRNSSNHNTITNTGSWTDKDPKRQGKMWRLDKYRQTDYKINLFFFVTFWNLFSIFSADMLFPFADVLDIWF